MQLHFMGVLCALALMAIYINNRINVIGSELAISEPSKIIGVPRKSYRGRLKAALLGSVAEAQTQFHDG